MGNGGSQQSVEHDLQRIEYEERQRRIPGSMTTYQMERPVYQLVQGSPSMTAAEFLGVLTDGLGLPQDVAPWLELEYVSGSRYRVASDPKTQTLEELRVCEGDRISVLFSWKPSQVGI